MSGSTMTWCVAPVAPPSPAVMAAATRAPNARESSSAPRPGSSSTVAAAAAAAAAAVVSPVASAVAVAASAVLAAAALSAADRGGAAQPSARRSPSGAVWRGSQRRQLSSPQRQRVWLRSCPLSAAPSAVPPAARPEDGPGRARPVRCVSLSLTPRMSPAPTVEEPSA